MRTLLALLLITSASIAATPKLNPIDVLNRDVATASFELEMFSMVADSNERQKHAAKFDAIKLQIEADLKPALNFANKHADLAKAVKAYYLAAQNYFDSAFATTAFEKASAQHAKSQLDAADNALHLEEKLVGLD